MPKFFDNLWVKPYISDELWLVLKSPILIENPKGGLIYGYPANILPEICAAILKAHEDGATTSRQKNIVRRARILLKGLATIGIISLVDEATGYEKVRKDRALATILEQFIAKELRPWVKTFPDAYYEQIYRLWEKEYPTDAKNHPQFIGKITNKLIYEPLAPGVLEELRKINPVLPSGNRETKHHQHLTDNHGVVELNKHLAVVVTLMQISSSREVFYRRFNEAFYDRHMKLPFEDDLDEL